MHRSVPFLIAAAVAGARAFSVSPLPAHPPSPLPIPPPPAAPPAPDFLRQDSADLLLGRARPDAAQPSGTGLRDAVPLRDFLAERSAARSRARLYFSARPGACVQAPDRDENRHVESLVLSGRALSPGLRDQSSQPALHRLQRRAEAREPEGDVS